MDDMQDEDYAWPSIAETQEFRLQCKAVVEEVIRTMPDPRETPITQESPYWSLVMGFEHERIHIETSSVLIRQLPVDAVVPPKNWPDCQERAASPADAPANELLDVGKGVAVLGKPDDFPEFGFDNEYGLREVEVPAFKASKFLVSNAEFLPFVLAGGYEEKKWWVSPSGDDEGWRWVAFRNAKHPSFWVATQDMPQFKGGRPDYPYQKDDCTEASGKGDQFRLRIEFSIVDMPWDWPAEVNYLEARAFLNWKQARDGGKVTYRVPTEAEYHLMRDDPSPFPSATTGKKYEGQVAGRLQPAAEALAKEMGGEVEHAAKYDVVMQPSCEHNTNFKYGSPSPVNHSSPSTAGFHDTHGNVWEWVEDHFAGLPGFQHHFLYDDFSTPCFDGWHTMILGGSWVSTGDQSSNFARYAFRRHFFQQLGFRYVALPEEAPKEAYPGAATVANLWEGNDRLSRAFTDSYAPKELRLPCAGGSGTPLSLDDAACYNQKLAELVTRKFTESPLAATKRASEAKVLLLGSGGGGAALELCRSFGRVFGVDSDEQVVVGARLMQHHGEREYERITEGVLTETTLVRAPEGVDRSRAVYVVGDAEELPADVLAEAPFDAVVVDSLLCRLRQPLNLVKALPQLVQVGGALVISSSNDWCPAHTPRNSWMGGFCMNGEQMSTLYVLTHNLKKTFSPQSKPEDLPRCSQKHARRLIVDLMEVSAWVRSGEAAPAGAAAEEEGQEGAAAGGAGEESKEE